MSESLEMEVYFKKDYLLHTGRSVKNYHTSVSKIHLWLLLHVIILICEECMGTVPHGALTGIILNACMHNYFMSRCIKLNRYLFIFLASRSEGQEIHLLCYQMYE